MVRIIVVLLALSSALAACGSSLPKPAAPLTAPAELCADATTVHPCRSVSSIEALLHQPRLEILGSAAPTRGIQGTKLLTLAAPSRAGPIVIRAKWRAYSTLSAFNDPRRELAAYAVQRLFLAPDQYVVPPTAGHCFELSAYRARVDAKAQSTFAGIPCVWGVLSYWIEHAHSLGDAEDEGLVRSDVRVFDERLFSKSAPYRDSAAHVNLLTFLIRHADSHPGQFIFGHDLAFPHLYSVDNSMSFGATKNPDVAEDWSKLIVPAISAETARRLFEIGERDLLELSVIEQFRRVAGGLVWTKPEPGGEPSPDGLRWTAASELRVGLTSAEIRGVSSRLDALKQSIASRHLRTY